MTQPQVASAATVDLPSNAEPKLEAPSRTPILITEREVIFGTAAAVPVQPTPTRGWIQAAHIVAAAWHRMFPTTTDSRPTRRHHPARYQYLDDARMARAMDRL